MANKKPDEQCQVFEIGNLPHWKDVMSKPEVIVEDHNNKHDMKVPPLFGITPPMKDVVNELKGSARDKPENNSTVKSWSEYCEK